MKFSLKLTKNSSRLGLITNVARLPGFEMETPHVFLYTKAGSVPHLTQDVLEMITNQRQGLNIPLSYVSYLQNRVKLFKQSIAEFIGMKEYLTYCSFIDPGEKRVCGFNEKNSVSVWSRYGREKFTVESYMSLIEDLKPDMFLLLADGDTDSESTRKRVGKAFNYSESYLEKCMQIYNQSTSLKSSQLLGAIEGGFDVTLREKSSKLIGGTNVFGVVIDGLHDCSETVSEMTSSEIKHLIEISLKHIPEDRLRIIHGCWNPSVVLDLVELGIDMFDSSYPNFISDHGGALIFPNTTTSFESSKPNGLSMKNTSVKQNGDASGEIMESNPDEPISKRIKLMKESRFHISLASPQHVTDFSPILENCNCLTCKNHTKAYIHHLLSVGELLAPTLLSIHNLHHYLVFMSTIRESLKSGKFQEFKEKFASWLNKMDNSLPP